MREQEVSQRLRTWLHHIALQPARADAYEPLLTTGIERGEVTLLARAQSYRPVH